MGDAVVVIVLLTVIGIAAWPTARRWLRGGASRPMVDPTQNITVDPVDGLPGIYQTTYRQRPMARGRRRYRAPAGTVVHQRRAEDPSRDTESAPEAHLRGIGPRLHTPEVTR
jgi:hypothetical protein